MAYPKFNSIFKDSNLEFFTNLLGDISIELADCKSLLLPYKTQLVVNQNGDTQPYFILDANGDVTHKGNSNCVAINLLVKYADEQSATPEDLLKYVTSFIEEKQNKMAKKRYIRLAKWVVKEATALKELLTKKQVKRLKKAKSICVDQIDGCIYAIIVGGNSYSEEAQELMEECCPRYFRSTKDIKKKDSIKEYGNYSFSCIEVALCHMSGKDVKNLVDFLTDKQYELCLNPEDWKFGEHARVVDLK